MFRSVYYVVLRRVLQLAALRFRSTDLKELKSSCFGMNLPSSGDARAGQ